MSDKDRARKEYPPDPNFSGAFAGGPPLMSEEEAKRLIDNPKAVADEIRNRWRRILRERADAAGKSPQSSG